MWSYALCHIFFLEGYASAVCSALTFPLIYSSQQTFFLGQASTLSAPRCDNAATPAAMEHAQSQEKMAAQLATTTQQLSDLQQSLAVLEAMTQAKDLQLNHAQQSLAMSEAQEQAKDLQIDQLRRELQVARSNTVSGEGHQQPMDVPVARGPLVVANPRLAEWIRKSDLQMADVPHKSYYTDWRRGLSHESITRVFTVLEQYRQSIPQNPTIVYAPERAGKSPAVLCIVKAAQIAGQPVIIFCAPTKKAPVLDMIEKLYRGGFDLDTHGINIAHTIAGKNTKRESKFDAFVLVAALTNHKDLEKAVNFIEAHRRSGRQVVAIMDEADEIVMGKGSSWTTLDPRHEPDNSERYLPDNDSEVEIEDGRYDDDMGSTNDSDDDDSDEQGGPRQRKVEVAKARKCFQEKIVPSAHLFMVTATVSGLLVDPLSFFCLEQQTLVLLVEMNDNYIGIGKFVILEGCEDYRAGLTTTNEDTSIFQEDHRNLNMLEKFIAHDNPHDGQCVTHAGDPSDQIKLKGAAYITTTNRVKADGGIHGLARDLHAYIKRKHPAFAKSTLIVSFVGQPHCVMGGKLHNFNPGSTFEVMYNEIGKYYKTGTVQIDGSDPNLVCFTDACTHVMLLGFTLTRRAMTAAFCPDDQPKTLVTPEYVIARSGRSSKVDADSQRIMRAGGDLGEYLVPEGYEVWISCNPGLLKNLNSLRTMEEESLKEQARSPKVHATFLNNYSVDTNGIADLKVTKRGLRLGGLGHGTQAYAAAQVLSTALEKFETFLVEDTDGLSGIDGTRRGGRSGKLKQITVLKYKNTIGNMMRYSYTGGAQKRQIRLTDIVTFDTLDDFINSPNNDYWHAENPHDHALGFRYLKQFSLTPDGADAIAVAERA